MKFSDYLKKIQNLPLTKRKIIFWILIIVLGLIIIAFWVMGLKQTIKNFSGEKALNEMNFPNLKEELDILPDLKDPTEEIKKDLDSIKKLQEKTE